MLTERREHLPVALERLRLLVPLRQQALEIRDLQCPLRLMRLHPDRDDVPRVRDDYALFTSRAARLPDSMAPFIHANQVEVCSPAK